MVSLSLGSLPWKAIGAAIVVLVVGALAGHLVWTSQTEITRTKLLPPDTPPAEYLYLDTDRVLAYLGQVEGGLPASAKRTESQTATTSASLKGGLIAEVNGTAEQSTSIEETVTPLATDRFFKLLVDLRTGGENRRGARVPWLQTIDAQLQTPDDEQALRKTLASLQEGDFVRIADARLYLPPFAALVPRARYAAAYVRGGYRATQPLSSHQPPATQQRQVNRYLRALGADPVLPFVAPTVSRDGRPTSAGKFVIPARYGSLLDNARLLSGSLTVVGKVIYIDRRARGDSSCAAHAGTPPRPCTYFDRQSAATFAVALDRAPATVSRLLALPPHRIGPSVAAALRFKSPVVVVLPVAIYQ